MNPIVPPIQQTTFIGKHMRQKYQDYVKACADAMLTVTMTYFEWLEIEAYRNAQAVIEYQTELASDLMRFFEGRIFRPPQMGEDLKQWIKSALADENAAYYKKKVNEEEVTELLKIDEKLLDYAVHQIKTVAEMNLTHSERRGALKMIAWDLENRVGSRNSSYPPGRNQATDDIPF